MRAVTQLRSQCLYEEDHCIERDGDDETVLSELYEEADFIVQLGDCDYRNWWRMIATYGRHRNDPPFPMIGAERKRGKRFGTRHAGSLYRDDPERYNRWDDICELEIRFFPLDLYRYQVKEPRAFPFVQPQDRIRVEPMEIGGDLRVCHTPSNPAKKCTGAIEYALERVRNVYYETITDVCFAEADCRRNTFHVLIDHLNPWHGCVGGACMEALANGLVVVTDDRHVKSCPESEQYIEHPPTLSVRTTIELSDTIRYLRDNPGYVDDCRWAGLEWAQKYLSSEWTYQYYSDAFAFAREYRP